MKWLQEQEKYLRDHYHCTAISTMVMHLKKDKRAIATKAWRMQLGPNMGRRKPYARSAGQERQSSSTVLSTTHKGFNRGLVTGSGKFETKPPNLKNLITVKIDRRTTVYCKPTQRIQDVLKKYKPLAQ